MTACLDAVRDDSTAVNMIVCVQSYVDAMTACLDAVYDHSSAESQSKLRVLVVEAVLLRDNRLKADINAARFFSREPSNFFAHLLVSHRCVACMTQHFVCTAA